MAKESDRNVEKMKLKGDRSCDSELWKTLKGYSIPGCAKALPGTSKTRGSPEFRFV